MCRDGVVHRHPPDVLDAGEHRPPLNYWYEAGDAGPEVALAATNAKEIEFAIDPEMTKFFMDVPQTARQDQMVLLSLNKEDNVVRQQVVKRDDDVLTKEQIDEHWADVQAAMHSGLRLGAT